MDKPLFLILGTLANAFPWVSDNAHYVILVESLPLILPDLRLDVENRQNCDFRPIL